MGENSIQKLLEESFSKSNRQEWERIATGELNGGEPFIQLRWKTTDELEFLPYYDRHDVATLDYLRNFDRPPATNTFLGNRTWYNLPERAVTGELSANREAIEQLSKGADGVLFTLKKTDVDVNALLGAIEPQYCLLSFRGTFTGRFFNDILAFLVKSGAGESTRVHFFSDKMSNALPEDFFSRFPLCKTAGLVIDSSTPVKEILECLLKGAQVILSGPADRIPARAIRNIAFSLPLHASFFTEIAKLKVLRMLWYQVVRSFGDNDYRPEDLHIHCRSEKFVKAQYEPHGNMIHTTIASMAAIVGGADSITVSPQEENAMLMRMARNVSNILREESHFDKVADPLAGAYAVDIMVDAMARKVWSMFQSTIQK